MADDKVEIIISVDADQAAAALKNFEQSSVKSLTKVQNTSASTSKAAASGFDAIKGSIAGLLPVMGPVAIAIAVASAAYQAFTKAMNQAAEATKLNLQINAALIATDEAGVGATESILAYAESLSSLTGVNDDAIATSFILAKSFGLTTEQSKKLTTAALDLSAATGQDLDTATRLLAQTFDGTIGKAGNLGSEFRNLTEAQLKSGAAIDLVTQKYAGAGAAALNTYEGQANRLSNSIDDLYKALGRSTTIDDGSGVKSFLAGVAEGIANIINKGKDAEQTRNALQRIASIDFNPIGEQSKELSTIVSELAAEADNSAKKISSIGLGADYSFTQMLSAIKPVKKSLELTGKALEDATKKAKDLFESGQKFKESILSSFGDQTATEANKASQAILSVEKAFREGLIKQKEAYDLKLTIVKSFNNKQAQLQKTSNEKELAEAEKQAKDLADIAAKEQTRITALFANPFKFEIKTKIEGGIDWKAAGKDFGIAAAGMIGLAGKGKEGAKSAVAMGAGMVATAFLGPAAGPIVEQIVLLLTNGKLLGAMVREFIKAIPEVLIAIADAIPEVMAAIVETVFTAEFLGRLVFALGKAFISIVTLGLLNFAPEWGRKIGEYLTQSWNGSGVAEQLANAGKEIAEFFQGFATALAEAFKPITDPIERLIKSIDAASGKGGGRGLIAEAGGKGGGRGVGTETLDKIMGFAKGGMVKPFYFANGTDTVPAMLTPGEMVIPRDMVGALGAFLSQANSNPETSNDTAILAAILVALQTPMTVNAEAKVNQSAFADIILQLNRQNLRLQA